MGLLLLLTLTVGLALAASPDEKVSDRGVFKVFQDGQEVGLERFNVQRGHAETVVRSELEYTLGGKKVRQQSELNLLTGDDLRSYTWQEGKATIEVAYRDGRVLSHYQPASGAAQDFEFVMPASTAIVDANFYIDWELLAQRYNRERGGAQQFQVFVPHSGDPDKVTLSSLGESPGADSHPTLHLQASTGAATLDLYLEAGRLMRLEGPSLVVTREK